MNIIRILVPLDHVVPNVHDLRILRHAIASSVVLFSCTITCSAAIVVLTGDHNVEVRCVNIFHDGLPAIHQQKLPASLTCLLSGIVMLSPADLSRCTVRYVKLLRRVMISPSTHPSHISAFIVLQSELRLKRSTTPLTVMIVANTGGMINLTSVKLTPSTCARGDIFAF